MTDVPPTNGRSFGAAQPPYYNAKSAQSWKLRFQGALATDKYPKKLNQELVHGVRERAWTNLKDESNRTFKSFTEFCEAPEPFGLGSPYELVNEFLIGLMGRQAVRRLTVQGPNQGARNDQLLAPGGGKGEKSTRHDSRKRTINDSPKVVQQLHDAGHLTMKETERFGVWARKEKKRREEHRAEHPKEKETTEAVLGFCERYAELAQGRVGIDDEMLAQVKADVAEIFPPPAYTVIETGDNSEGLEDILNLHVARSSTVADLTYGRGVFWTRIDTTQYELLPSDLTYTGTDSRSTEYRDSSVDSVVFDPPYMHTKGGSSKMAQSLERAYLTDSRDTHGHRGVLQLYENTAREAARILRPEGIMIVKCQDEVESGQNRWSHIDIKQSYECLGFEAIDLFLVLRRDRPPASNHKARRQYHARKVHSYFWVFRLKDRAKRRREALSLIVSPVFAEKLKQLARKQNQDPSEYFMDHLEPKLLSLMEQTTDMAEEPKGPRKAIPRTEPVPQVQGNSPDIVAQQLRNGLRMQGFKPNEIRRAVDHFRPKITEGEDLTKLFLDAIQFLTPDASGKR